MFLFSVLNFFLNIGNIGNIIPLKNIGYYLVTGNIKDAKSNSLLNSLHLSEELLYVCI